MTGQRRRPTTHRPAKKGKGVASILFWALLLLGMPVALFFGWQMLTASSEDEQKSFSTTVDNSTREISGDRAVVLVFPTWDASSYVTELRQITSRNRQGEDLLGIISNLCQGPEVSGTISAIPEGTTALAAFYNAKTSTVVLDFSQHIVTGHPGGSAAEEATLTSILRTVSLNFPEIKECVILVDGSQVETLAGHLDLDHSFILRRWL